MAAEASCALENGDEEIVACAVALVVFGGGPGARPILARSGSWLRLCKRHDATHCVAFSSTVVPVGVTGSVGLLVLRIIEAVLEFFSRQEEDLSDAYPYRFGGSVMFRKDLPVYSTGRFMPGDCLLGWDSVMCTHVFLSHCLVSEKEL
jgi:hypothetical protein